jgi:hypothetical protein
MDETVIISLPINPAPTFEADVAIVLPGSRAEAVLRFEFNHMTREELIALDRAYLGVPDPAADPQAPQRELMTDADMVERIVKRWVIGPVDDDKRPVAYNRDALDRLLNAYPGAAGVIYVTHQRELREARVKNSGRQPGR